MTDPAPSPSVDDHEREEALAEIDETSLPHQLPRNNWRNTLIRLAVSVGFLAVLIWRLPEVTVHDLVPELTTATFSWIAFAVGIHIVAYVLQTLRWSQVSDTLGIRLRFRRMFSHLLAGEFVSNALPTSFGGDVVRVMRQGQDTGDYADAFAATALERLTGWLVLPLISGVAFVVATGVPAAGHRDARWPSSSTWPPWSASSASSGSPATNVVRGASSDGPDGLATSARCTWA